MLFSCFSQGSTFVLYSSFEGLQCLVLLRTPPHNALCYKAFAYSEPFREEAEGLVPCCYYTLRL